MQNLLERGSQKVADLGNCSADESCYLQQADTSAEAGARHLAKIHVKAKSSREGLLV